MRVPFGLKRTCDTWSVCPSRTVSSCPVRPSQSRAVWSNEAVTARLPSGLKATVRILFLCPARTASNRPVAASQRCAVLSG